MASPRDVVNKRYQSRMILSTVGEGVSLPPKKKLVAAATCAWVNARRSISLPRRDYQNLGGPQLPTPPPGTQNSPLHLRTNIPGTKKQAPKQALLEQNETNETMTSKGQGFRFNEASPLRRVRLQPILCLSLTAFATYVCFGLFLLIKYLQRQVQASRAGVIRR